MRRRPSPKPSEGGLPAEAIGEGGTVGLYLVPMMLVAI